MKKILNKLGLYTNSQYNSLKKENESVKRDLGDANELIYNFDGLLGKYSPQQLNSLYYKMVNLCWTDNNKKFLLERWQKRINNAAQTAA